MNRRAFLKLLGIGGAAATSFVMDPDMLLWQPGKKTIFLPTAGRVEVYTEAQAESFIHPDYLMEFARGGARHQEFNAMIRAGRRDFNHLATLWRLLEDGSRPG